MVGFRFPMGPPSYVRVCGSNFHVKVMSNAILLEWVPTGLIRASNKARQNLKPLGLSCIPTCNASQTTMLYA
jgi:hypothetical protein